MRLHVDAPVFTPSPFGLLAVAEPRDGGDPHFQMGVQWEDVCGGASTTVADCDTSAPVITGSGMIPAKSATTTRSLWGATPFTVYTEVDCSPVDFWDNQDVVAQRAFDRYESFAAERAFWTGVALDKNQSGGFQNAVLPHLASSAAVTETSLGRTTTLQLAATIVTGAALNVVNALGALEGALAACLNGTGVIHVPQALAPDMALLVVKQGGRLYTPNGNLVVIGAGYPGTGPSTPTTPPTLGTAWMYATGPVFAYRSTAKIYAKQGERIDRTVDTVKTIVERTYVLGYDCCLFAQQVNTASFIATSTSTP